MTERTLVDTNVLLDIVTEDPTWATWSGEALADAADSGILVLSPIVYAELGARFSRIEDLDEAVSDFVREPLPWDAAFLAVPTPRRHPRAHPARLPHRRPRRSARLPPPDPRRHALPNGFPSTHDHLTLIRARAGDQCVCIPTLMTRPVASVEEPRHSHRSVGDRWLPGREGRVEDHGDEAQLLVQVFFTRVLNSSPRRVTHSPITGRVRRH